MKKIYSSLLLLVALLAIGVSCTDTSLDPLQMDQVKKGTILALRGKALDNLYSKGLPVAEVFPKIANGTEKFTFESEILAEDPATVASVDVYVVKKVGSGTERKLMTNVPASQFTAGAYAHPSTTITLTLPNTMTALGLPATFPMSSATANTMLTDYKFGVPIEVDINLVDGTKILASDIVNVGLFASNQFYPAMKLTWAMTDYCAYDATTWTGAWVGTEVGSCCSGDDKNNIRAEGTIANRFIMDNWWGDGVDVYFDMTVSTDPSTQTIKVPTQTTSENAVASGTGTYNQCTNTFTINASYVYKGTTYTWIYPFVKQ